MMMTKPPKSDEGIPDDLMNQFLDEDAGLGETFEDLGGDDKSDSADKKRAAILRATQRRLAKEQAAQGALPMAAQSKQDDLDFEEILDDDVLNG